jgi:predicted  nucleic acid-binding Zn-ribbon protein
MDGLYNSDSLCFVLSKTDLEFDVADYIKQSPELAESTAEDSRKLRAHKGNVSELKRQIDSTRKQSNESMKRAKKLSKEIQDVNLRLEAISNSSGNLCQKRKRTVNDRDASEFDCHHKIYFSKTTNRF